MANPMPKTLQALLFMAPPRAPGGVITLNSISRTKEAPETSVPALGGWKWLEKGFGGTWDVHCFTGLVIFREDFLDGSYLWPWFFRQECEMGI